MTGDLPLGQRAPCRHVVGRQHAQCLLSELECASGAVGVAVYRRPADQEDAQGSRRAERRKPGAEPLGDGVTVDELTEKEADGAPADEVDRDLVGRQPEAQGFGPGDEVAGSVDTAFIDLEARCRLMQAALIGDGDCVEVHSLNGFGRPNRHLDPAVHQHVDRRTRDQCDHEVDAIVGTAPHVCGADVVVGTVAVLHRRALVGAQHLAVETKREGCVVQGMPSAH